MSVSGIYSLKLQLQQSRISLLSVFVVHIDDHQGPKAIGAEFAGEDAEVVALQGGLWRSRYGADPHIAGKQIEIDTQKFTIVGVVAPVLQFMEQAQLYVPLAFTPAQLDPNARGHQNTDVVARLKRGVTLDQARAEMKVVAARMTGKLPKWYPADWNIELDPLADQVAGELRTPLLVLLGAVAMVLLMAA